MSSSRPLTARLVADRAAKRRVRAGRLDFGCPGPGSLEPDFRRDVVRFAIGYDDELRGSIYAAGVERMGGSAIRISAVRWTQALSTQDRFLCFDCSLRLPRNGSGQIGPSRHRLSSRRGEPLRIINASAERRGLHLYLAIQAYRDGVGEAAHGLRRSPRHRLISEPNDVAYAQRRADAAGGYRGAFSPDAAAQCHDDSGCKRYFKLHGAIPHCG